MIFGGVLVDRSLGFPYTLGLANLRWPQAGADLRLGSLADHRVSLFASRRIPFRRRKGQAAETKYDPYGCQNPSSHTILPVTSGLQFYPDSAQLQFRSFVSAVMTPLSVRTSFAE